MRKKILGRTTGPGWCPGADCSCALLYPGYTAWQYTDDGWQTQLLSSEQCGKQVTLPPTSQPGEHCDTKQCAYTDIPLTKTGFYIVQVRLKQGSQEGFWGLEMNTSSGANTGSLYAGTVLKENGQEAGLMGFHLGTSEKIKLTVVDYSNLVPKMRVVVQRQDQTGQHITVYGPLASPTNALVCHGDRQSFTILL